MSNKELAQKFLTDNEEVISTMTKELIAKVEYNSTDKLHQVIESGEIFTNKMLEEEIGKQFSEFPTLPYRQKWIIVNKIYFMLLPIEERELRLKEHKKKVNKNRIKKINKKRKIKKAAKKASTVKKPSNEL